MTISKNSIRYKLYKSFAIVLAMVLLLFIANYLAVRREHNAKAASAQAMTLKEATGKIRFQMMQNHCLDYLFQHIQYRGSVDAMKYILFP